MKESNIYKIIIGIILFLSINSNNLEIEPTLLSKGGPFTLDDILDAATRVKNYVLKHKNIPKEVRVSSDDLTIARFTYAMGVAIKNIHDKKKENKISVINLSSPSSQHPCNKKVELAGYIDAINRILIYSQKNGAAPAYVTSSSVEIGFKEYTFGFSKILDYYRHNQKLPSYNNFDSSVFQPGPNPNPSNIGSEKNQEIKGVSFVKGINEKNTETNIEKYIKKTNRVSLINGSIKRKAKELTSGCKTTLQKAKAIFNFVRDNIKYEGYFSSRYGAAMTLLKKKGNCSDQTNLLVALCRASGIPVKYAHGLQTYFYVSKKTYEGHVWGQILIGNIWYAADTTSINNSLGFIKNWNFKKFGRLRQYDLLPF